MPIFNGTSASETLTGTADADEIYGFGGNDVLNGGQGIDLIEGGDGNDYINHNTSTNYQVDDFSFETLNGGAGNDVIDIGFLDTADGGDGFDRLTTYQSWRFSSGVNWDLSGVADILGWLNTNLNINARNFEQFGLAAGDADDVIIGFDLNAVGGLASTIEGFGGNDRLEGRGGQDELYGGDGNDILRGDDGDDLLNGGQGDDSIEGGAGIDAFAVTILGEDPANVTIDLTVATAQDTGAGMDTISGVEHIFARSTTATQVFNLFGDAQGNVLLGGLGDDVIDGRDGADSIRGGAGGDTLTGGLGLDEIVYSTSDAGVVIDLDANTASGGHAQGDVISGFENAAGSEFGDNLTGSALANRLVGLGGDDTLNGLAGMDMLIGGAGADVINGGDDNDQLWNFDQRETSADNAVDTINGGGGNDNITLGEGDIGDGGDGFDQAFVGFYGRGSGIVLDLGAGAEAAVEALGGFQLSNFEAIHVTGTAFGDVITGSAAGEQINGAEGADTLTGGGGLDTLLGGLGDDILDGGVANDTLRGQGGNDLYLLDDAGDVVFENLNDGTDEVRTGLASHTLGVNVENLTFTTGTNHVGVGNASNNILAGHDGDDTLTGAGGDDIIHAGAGSDTAVFAGNRDTWTISYLGDGIHVSNGVEHNLLTGVEFLAFADGTIPVAVPAVINGTEDADTLSGDETTPAVEIIHGLGGGDTIHGHGENDALYGDDGDDVIHGGEGSDHVEGGVGGDSLSGEGGADALYGGDGADVINGGEGDDHMEGGAGVDSLSGEGGNDVLIGGGETDILYGGGGDDQIDGGAGSNYLGGEAGADTLTSGADADQLDGGDDNDILTAGAGNDTLFGGAGDDQLNGGTQGDSLTGGMGADLLNGGDGDDHIYYTTAVTIDLTGVVAATGEAAGDVFVSIENFHLSDFNDEFTGTSALEFIYGGGGDDVIRNGGGGTHTYGEAGNDHIFGGGGPEEYLYGMDGDDHIEGGDGDDFMFGETGNDIFDGGVGNDGVAFQLGGQRVTVDLRIQTAQLLSEELGWDTLISIEQLRGEAYQEFHFTGNAAHNNMFGNGLDDVILGMEGSDSLSGNGGDDHLDGGDDNDYLYGASGDDLMLGGAGADFLYGEGESDVLDGGLGADSVDGGAGNDRLTGRGGVDGLIGGDGVDTADYAAAAGGVTASLLAGAASNDGDGASDTLSGIENLTGSAFADALTGDAGVNLLIGGAGADSLDGGEGDDVLRGGTGVDVMAGGDGYDTADYSAAAAGVTARLDTMRATNDGDGGTDTFTSIETILGSNFNDTLIGGATGDVLRGGLGTDTLLGQGGNDVLWGGAGALNQLQGGLGDDTYVLEAADSIVELAGQGVDTVDARINVYVLSNANVENLSFGGTGDFTGTGNAAANVITGGAGNDVLRGRGGVDVLNGGDGVDTADYTLAAAGVVARIDLQRATNDGDGATDTYTNVENLIGSNFNDTLIGGATGNLLQGGIGSDILLGQGGDDILMGGSGLANQLQGGLGDDRYILDAFDTCVEAAGQGIDTVEARIGSYTMGANIENLLYTGPGSFVGTGNALNNTITGGARADILRGGGGDDNIYGGDGTDELQLRGVAANYTITAEGNGYRIVDSVAGRDGSTYVESMEVVRFSNNTYRVLTYPPPAPTPLDAADKDFGAQVLPSLEDDAFVLPALVDDEPLILPGLAAAKAADEPLVLPGQDGLAALFLEARLAQFADRMLVVDHEGRIVDGPAHREEAWLF